MKWLLVLMLVAANALGDLLNAAGMRRNGEVRDFRPSGIRKLIVSLLHNRFVLGGVMVMIVAFFTQMALLSISDVSFAIPATASSYMIETILAKVLLGEQISGLRWTGAALVAAGVSLLAV